MNLREIAANFKRLLINYYPISQIFSWLINILVKEFDLSDKTKREIIIYGAFYCKRCIKGYKYMAHLLAYVTYLIRLIYIERNAKK